MIATTRSTTVSTTRYTFVGTPCGVRSAIDALLRRYPPAGYGTMQHMPTVLQDGRVSVDVTLSNSCD